MIPLHVHSYYTLLQGTISPENIIKRCAEYGLKSIAITDTNAMNGSILLAKSAKENNIKPIIGTCITDLQSEDVYALLLAINNKGYSDLCRIITARKLNDDFSLEKTLAGKLENLFIISPSVELAKCVNKENDFYLEMITVKSEKKNNRNRYEFAKSNNINITATNPVYFLNKEDFEIHKTVTAIRLNRNINNLEQEDTVDEEYYFKDPKQIEKEWASLPEALETSEYIAKNCNTDIKLNEYKFPLYDLPEGETADEYLSKKSFEGLTQKYNPVTKVERERLEYELKIIREMNFSNYFLIVWDIVNEAKRRGMLIIGRGSAANSITAYCLGVTQVDPIEQNLYFERFLNKARSSPPDFDIDFSWKERDEIIKYIFEKYGYEKVAMISTTVTFRARSAFRETAKAFGFTNTEISTLSRKIPWTDAANLPNIPKLFPEAKNLEFDRKPWKTIAPKN